MCSRVHTKKFVVQAFFEALPLHSWGFDLIQNKSEEVCGTTAATHSNADLLLVARGRQRSADLDAYVGQHPKQSESGHRNMSAGSILL